MVSQRIYKSSPWNVSRQEQRSPFASRPFAVQQKKTGQVNSILAGHEAAATEGMAQKLDKAQQAYGSSPTASRWISNSIQKPGAIHRKIDKEMIDRIKETIDIKDLDIKVIEVPKSGKTADGTELRATTEFTEYPKESLHGLSPEDKSKSIAAINDLSPEEEQRSVLKIMEDFGGAAYVNGYCLIIEDMVNYERNLKHEMGHHKQEAKQGMNSSNTSRKILEYHNILFNENEGEKEPRLYYTQDWSLFNPNNVTKLRLERTLGNCTKVEAEMSNLIKESTKPKDLEVHIEITEFLKKIETRLASEAAEATETEHQNRIMVERHRWACFRYNYAKEASSALRDSKSK